MVMSFILSDFLYHNLIAVTSEKILDLILRLEKLLQPF